MVAALQDDLDLDDDETFSKPEQSARVQDIELSSDSSDDEGLRHDSMQTNKLVNAQKVDLQISETSDLSDSGVNSDIVINSNKFSVMQTEHSPKLDSLSSACSEEPEEGLAISSVSSSNTPVILDSDSDVDNDHDDVELTNQTSCTAIKEDDLGGSDAFSDWLNQQEDKVCKKD